jgi:hypothetical protein
VVHPNPTRQRGISSLARRVRVHHEAFDGMV